MIRSRLTATILSLLILALGRLQAQAPDRDSKQEVARTRKLLEVRISVDATDMPLGKLLESLEKRLPAGRKLALRIDAAAFGKDAAKIAETPIHLPKLTNVSMGTVLRLALGQVAAPPKDIRLDAGTYVITTPARALYTATYNVHDLLEKPLARALNLVDADHRENAPELATRTAELVRIIVNTIDPKSWYPNTEAHGTIRIVNGHLVIQANADRHAQVEDLLDALRRLNDVSVRLDARLYQVNRETYRKVRDAKRLTHAELEDMEKRAPETGSLLKDRKPVAASEHTTIASGQESGFLSQYKVVVTPPVVGEGKLPAEIAAGLAEPQTVLEGISFSALAIVSADRRFVRLKVTGKATEIEQLPAPLPALKKPNKSGDVQEQVSDLLDALRRAGPLKPVLSETVHSQETEVPDGGTRLIAIPVRPRSLQAERRWWVLALSPRIVIQAEEHTLLEETVKASVPALLRDILTNPALKTTRGFYGTADDDRFALVPNERWTWSEPPAIKEHRQVTPERKGKRLLGIRIDDFGWTGKDQSELAITASLVNAGGAENGAVPGSGRLRYLVRMKGKEREVKLQE